MAGSAVTGGALPTSDGTVLPPDGTSNTATATDTQAVPVEEAGVAPIGNERGGVPTAAILGLLALLGIGGAGIAAMRSRRRRDPVMEPAHTTIPASSVAPEAPAAQADSPVAGEPVMSAPTHKADERMAYPATAGTAVAAPTIASPAVSAAGPTSNDAPVANREMPARAHRPIAARDLDGPVGTGEAREELLREMVAAEPDESNPFLSPKARRRRARVILQHREAMQRHGSDARFDWRTYKPTSKAADPVDDPMVPA